MTPREELAGFPICPYAKQAITSNQHTVTYSKASDIEKALLTVDIGEFPVTIVIIIDYMQYSVDDMREKTAVLNNKYREKDLAILDNDPRTPFIINNVTTTFSGCYLWIVQSLSDLNHKHEALSKTNYYSVWTKKQLDEVVNWRK